jgi:hypothetical protein
MRAVLKELLTILHKISLILLIPATLISCGDGGGIASASALDATSTGLTPLTNQPYALCAGANTFNFDGIAYAKCKLLNGNSLGITHAYPTDSNVQTVNTIGITNNHYVVSTYSPPNASQFALYSCNKAGAYAQCNGGLCFNSTIGKPFPKIGPLDSDEIICSCPVVASKSYHVTASSTCPTTQAQYDQICGAGVSTEQSANGLSVYIGSDGPPAGTLALNVLYRATFGGSPSPESVCPYPAK